MGADKAHVKALFYCTSLHHMVFLQLLATLDTHGFVSEVFRTTEQTLKAGKY